MMPGTNAFYIQSPRLQTAHILQSDRAFVFAGLSCLQSVILYRFGLLWTGS